MKQYDKAFLKKLQQREDSAFTILYNDTVDTFFRYLKTTYFLGESEIDDLISSFYVKLWENLKRLDVNASLSGWMRTIFKNLTKDYFKAHSATHFSQMSAGSSEDEGSTFEENISSEVNVSEMFSVNREYEKIVAGIDALEGDYKEVLYLKYVEEKSYEEIAQMLKSTEQTIRQKVSRGLKKLKSGLSS